MKNATCEAPGAGHSLPGAQSIALRWLGWNRRPAGSFSASRGKRAPFTRVAAFGRKPHSSHRLPWFLRSLVVQSPRSPLKSLCYPRNLRLNPNHKIAPNYAKLHLIAVNCALKISETGRRESQTRLFLSCVAFFPPHSTPKGTVENPNSRPVPIIKIYLLKSGCLWPD